MNILSSQEYTDIVCQITEASENKRTISLSQKIKNDEKQNPDLDI